MFISQIGEQAVDRASDTELSQSGGSDLKGSSSNRSKTYEAVILAVLFEK